MSTKNPYESLKIDCLADVEPVEAESCWTVTDDNTESVKILTSLLPDGAWVYGYSVYWANGSSSIRQPTAANGRFRSQRDAQLYALGFMLAFARYFTDNSRAALRSAEASLSQTELFS